MRYLLHGNSFFCFFRVGSKPAGSVTGIDGLRAERSEMMLCPKSVCFFSMY